MQLNPTPTRGTGLRQSGRRPSLPPLASPSRPPQRLQTQQRPGTPPSPSGGPRRSEQLRRVPTCPGNVYGEQRHPTDIERDTRRTQTWREMTEEQCRSQLTSSRSDHFQETNPGPSPPHSSDDPDQSLGEHSKGSDDSSQSVKSMDEVEESLSYLVYSELCCCKQKHSHTGVLADANSIPARTSSPPCLSHFIFIILYSSAMPLSRAPINTTTHPPCAINPHSICPLRHRSCHTLDSDSPPHSTHTMQVLCPQVQPPSTWSHPRHNLPSMHSDRFCAVPVYLSIHCSPLLAFILY